MPGRNQRPTVEIVVLAFEASRTIGAVLEALAQLMDSSQLSHPTVLVADDASTDDTSERALAFAAAQPGLAVGVARRPRNLGYGGNQKACIRSAIDDGVEVLAFVHGDGQHPVSMIPALVRPILRGEADAVQGSRMLSPGSAKRGGMPALRRIGTAR